VNSSARPKSLYLVIRALLMKSGVIAPELVNYKHDLSLM
jgi:hypothetical protein